MTTPCRTLIDLAACLTQDELRDALDEALVRELVGLPRLERRLEGVGRRGRPGAGVLSQLLRHFDGSDLPAQTILERRYLEASRRFRLPEPVLQHPVCLEGRSYRIDFAYPTVKLAVELDGWRYHGGRQAWEADIRRANALVAAGWKVVRGTWRDVNNDPAPLLKQVAELLVPRLIAGS